MTRAMISGLCEYASFPQDADFFGAVKAQVVVQATISKPLGPLDEALPRGLLLDQLET